MMYKFIVHNQLLWMSKRVQRYDIVSDWFSPHLMSQVIYPPWNYWLFQIFILLVYIITNKCSAKVWKAGHIFCTSVLNKKWMVTYHTILSPLVHFSSHVIFQWQLSNSKIIQANDGMDQSWLFWKNRDVNSPVNPRYPLIVLFFEWALCAMLTLCTVLF